MNTPVNPIEEGSVDVPEAEIIDEGRGNQASRKTMSTMLKLVLISGALMTVILGGIIWSVNKEVAANRVTNLPALDTTPGGINQAESERFREYVEGANDQGAENATDRGTTFIPTPEAIMGPADPMTDGNAVAIDTETPAVVEPPVEVRAPIPAPPPIERTPVPAPPVRQAPAPAQQQAGNGQAQPEPPNPYTDLIRQQMASVASAYTPRVSALGDGPVVETARDRAAAAAEAAALAAANAGDTTASGELFLRPGDILYGETLTTVSSDANSPVLVELTTGQFKGARLVGTFTVPEGADTLVVQFSRMTLTDGTTVGINGFAVDGKTAETAVASDIERRYVARYLPLFASTFVSGFAAAAAKPAQTVSDNGNGVTVSTEQSTTREAALSGLSAAAGLIAADIGANAPKGPKISLRDGYPIAIMILDPATVGQPIEAPLDVRPFGSPGLGVPNGTFAPSQQGQVQGQDQSQQLVQGARAVSVEN